MTTAVNADRDMLITPCAEQLTAVVSGRFVRRIVEVQAYQETAAIVLTGGRTGVEILRNVCRRSDRELVDWSRVDVFWTDERFVNRNHPDRNDGQARRALLDHVSVDPERVHSIGAAVGTHSEEPEQAAAAYRRVVEQHARAGGPTFDLCLLGIGEDGHVASMFPGHEAMHERELAVVVVRDSPKPPSIRITLTMPAICDSSEVWLVASGREKAEAVSNARRGPDMKFPASLVRGREQTLWFLDAEAAFRDGPA